MTYKLLRDLLIPKKPMEVTVDVRIYLVSRVTRNTIKAL